MMTTYRFKLAALSAAFLSACATPTVVQSVKPGDNGLSCAQLQNEFADADRLRAAADAEKSVTGGNVVRAIFFWPAILGTASNANEAIAAADSRKVHLANQMNQKNCAIPTSAQVVSGSASEPTQTTGQSKQSKEMKLAELKRLHEANLISKDVYSERQKAVLESTSN